MIYDSPYVKQIVDYLGEGFIYELENLVHGVNSDLETMETEGGHKPFTVTLYFGFKPFSVRSVRINFPTDIVEKNTPILQILATINDQLAHYSRDEELGINHQWFDIYVDS